MAEHEIKITIGAKDEASKQIKAIDKELAKLQKEKATVELDVDAKDAAKQLETLDKQIAELQGEKAQIVVEAKVSQALGALDDVAVEAKKAEAAADTLSTALGPELGAKADLDSIIADFRRMGLSLDEITANADRLGAKLREVGERDIGGRLTTGFNRIDASAKSASSSSSVLANAVGNSVQDLGAVAGLAGTAGVAIGQMGEYMVDAANSGDKMTTVLANFGKVAGPIALIAGGLQIVSSIMKGIETEKAFRADLVEGFQEGLEDAIPPLQTIYDTLAATGELLFETGALGGGGILGLGSKARDLVPIFEDLGFKTDQWLALLEDPRGAAENFIAEAEAMGNAHIDQQNMLIKAADGLLVYADAQDDAALADKRRRRILAGLNTAGILTAEQQQEVADAFNEVGGAIRDGTEDAEAQTAALLAQGGVIDTLAKTYDDWAAAMTAANLILSQGPTVESAVAGISKFQDQMFGLSRIASTTEAAYDSLGAAIAENGHTFDLNTAAGRANQQVLESLANSLIPGVAAAFTDADGNIDRFKANMDTLRGDVFGQLRAETDLTDSQIQDVLRRLGMFDGATYEAQFNLLGTADAEAKLAILLPMLDSLNLAPDISKDVALHVLAGDPVAALADIQRGVDAQPAPTVPVDPVVGDMAQFERELYAKLRFIQLRLAMFKAGLFDAGGTAGGFGGIAGEKGPEILNRRFLTLGPTYVPPGTKVTSRRQTRVILNRNGGRGLKRYDSGGVVAGPRQVNINVSAAVIGNQFDVTRAVRRAEKDIARLYGTRA